jgi:hypothetical protein
MRQIFTILVMTLSLKAVYMQAQTIQNGSFESLNSDGTLRNWGNVYLMSVWIDSSGVSHSDSIVYDGPFYAPTNDAFHGNTALELRNAWNFTSNIGIAGAVGLDDDSVFSSFANQGHSIFPFCTCKFWFLL